MKNLILKIIGNTTCIIFAILLLTNKQIRKDFELKVKQHYEKQTKQLEKANCTNQSTNALQN